MSDNIGIQIVKFWTNYKPGKDGRPVGIDMVMYGPVGRIDRQCTTSTVASLGRLQPYNPGDNNIAVQMAHARWQRIEPAYRAWKEGREIPATGTPLGAWPQLAADQVEGLHMLGIRSVEDVANASESVLQKFPFSSARDVQKSAKLFLSAFDKQKTAQDIEQLQAEKDELKDQLEEMRQIVLGMQRQTAGAVPVEAPRRSRQPKATVETSEEVAA